MPPPVPDAPGGQLTGRLPDEDTARLSQLGQAGRNIDRIADHGEA
jgi:hypothetical protein